jgi:DNA-binding transcriptional MerR regulator
MNWKEYLELSEKTLSTQFHCEEREQRILHAVIGVLTEVEELLDNHIGDEQDITNMLEEAGDITWYLAIIGREMDLDYPQLLVKTKNDNPMKLVLKIVKRLLDTGVSLQNIRTAVEHLRSRGVSDLESITLMSDGASIYECTSPDEIVDLLQGGQGVFGIAIGKVWSEVEGSLSLLQGESLEDGSLVVSGESNDELAQRRKLKGA